MRFSDFGPLFRQTTLSESLVNGSNFFLAKIFERKELLEFIKKSGAKILRHCPCKTVGKYKPRWTQTIYEYAQCIAHRVFKTI